MHTCLCVRRHVESSFHQCGGPVKLVQASLKVRKDVERSFHHWRFCEACSYQFECLERSKEQFSPLCRSCETVGQHFQWNGRPTRKAAFNGV